MELSFQMTLTFSCSYLLSVLPVSICFVNEHFNYGSTTSDFNGYSCNSHEVIREFYTESDLQCGYACAKDDWCGSYFYHHGDKTCVTCSGVYLSTSGMDTYPGMSYYVLKGVLGRWNEWSAWSLCSATCDGGTRMRMRTCAVTGPPCVGDAAAMESCNAYACTPLARTCADWASRGLNESRSMAIDPDGDSGGFSIVSVDCDLDTEPGKAFTVIHHDTESRTHVMGWEGCGDYETILLYMGGFETARLIADISDNCRQFVQWECHKAVMIHPSLNVPCTFWRNRTRLKSAYFTGPYTSGTYCYCGDQGNCEDPTLQCNCDKQEAELKQDGGYITNKGDLPIYSFAVGDTDVVGIFCRRIMQDPTLQCNCDKQEAELKQDGGYVTQKGDLPIYSFAVGDTGGSDEYGYYTIGPLMCW